MSIFSRVLFVLSALVLLTFAFETITPKSLLKRDLPTEELHPMVSRYAQEVREGVFEQPAEALEAIKRENEALASRLIYLAKRQSNSTTTTTPPPPPPPTTTTPAPPPPTTTAEEPSSTSPVTLFTTLPGGQRSTFTSYTVVAGPTSYQTPTGPAGTTSTPTQSIGLQNGAETSVRLPSAAAAIVAVIAVMLAF